MEGFKSMERFNWCHSSQNMLNHDASIEQSVDKDPSQQLAGDEPLREKNDEHQSKCLLEETIQIDDEHQSDDGNPGVNAENQSGRLNVQDDGDLNNRHEALTGKIQFGPVLRNATITYQPKSAMSLFLNSTDQHTRVPGEDLRRAALEFFTKGKMLDEQHLPARYRTNGPGPAVESLIPVNPLVQQDGPVVWRPIRFPPSQSVSATNLPCLDLFVSPEEARDLARPSKFNHELVKEKEESTSYDLVAQISEVSSIEPSSQTCDLIEQTPEELPTDNHEPSQTDHGQEKSDLENDLDELFALMWLRYLIEDSQDYPEVSPTESTSHDYNLVGQTPELSPIEPSNQICDLVEQTPEELPTKSTSQDYNLVEQTPELSSIEPSGQTCDLVEQTPEELPTDNHEPSQTDHGQEKSDLENDLDELFALMCVQHLIEDSQD